MKFIPKVKLSLKVALAFVAMATVSSIGVGFYFFMKTVKEIPEIMKVSDYHPFGVTQIISVENNESKVMAEYYTQRRYLTPFDQIPKRVVQAFISAEDSQFFEHQGINPVSIIRAAVANFLAGQVVQGGSTITQQIAKSLYLTSDRHLIRKLKETYLAFQLEKHLTKEEILYLYLNQIYLGSHAYGVQGAARQYFHKDLKNLDLAEIAIIAGMPTAPGKFSPLLNPKRAKERQLYVLKRMKENKYITEKEQQDAAKERVKIYVNDGTEQKLAPHLAEHIRRYLVEKYGDKAVNEDGMTVIIPAAIRYYQYATEALESGLEEVDQRKGYRGAIKNVPPAEWEKTKDEIKHDLALALFPYRLLLEDGRLDLQSAVEEFDPTFQKSLTGKKTRALVTQINLEQKVAYASIGLTSVQIPFDSVKWAFPAGKPATATSEAVPAGKAPKAISDVLHIGDLIWLKNLKLSGSSGWVGALTQIPEVEGALYSVDVETGQILAMVGGYDYGKSEFNRAVQAKRQVGSTIKPIIYSAALEHGYTAGTVIVDSPIVFDDAENGRWKPENFEEKFYGDTLFRQALIESRNVPTIKIVQDIKVSTVINQANRLGLSGPFNHDLSISLGTVAASVQDMVHAFTAFPLQGKPFHPVLFQKILDRDGRILETAQDAVPKPDVQSTPNPSVEDDRKSSGVSFEPTLPGYRLDPRVAYVMTHIMKEVVQYGTATKASALGRPVAGKTGTTQDFRDGWFIGFTPKVVTGVWVGYDDQRPMGRGEVGANTALPIWIKYMQNALKSYPAEDFTVPEGIVMVGIDSKTGKRSSGRGAISEAFIAGTEPGAAHEWTKKIGADGDNAPKAEKSKSEPAEDDEFLKEDN